MLIGTGPAALAVPARVFANLAIMLQRVMKATGSMVNK